MTKQQEKKHRENTWKCYMQNADLKKDRVRNKEKISSKEKDSVTAVLATQDID